MTIVRKLLVFIVAAFYLTACAKQAPSNTSKSASLSSINKQWELNGHRVEVVLEESDTTKALLTILPDEFAMTELHKNEKYYTLPKSVPTKEARVETIEAGDVMVYGNNTLVVFYRTFPTNYSYTRIGRIKNEGNLAELLGEGDIKVTLRRDERKE